MREPTRRLEERLGHKFANQQLLEQALTHRSAASLNNERLEFLGDSILSFIVATALYHRRHEANEGTLTRLRASLVRKETLATLARSIRLGEHLILGPGELKSGGRDRDSILADAFEALVGAMYLDSGLEACQRCVVALLGEKLSAMPRSDNKDAKTQLQEQLQARHLSLPNYEILEVTGEAHEHLFTVRCHLPSHDSTTTGQGSNRRAAEQEAARLALAVLDLAES